MNEAIKRRLQIKEDIEGRRNKLREFLQVGQDRGSNQPNRVSAKLAKAQQPVPADLDLSY